MMYYHVCWRLHHACLSRPSEISYDIRFIVHIPVYLMTMVTLIEMASQMLLVGVKLNACFYGGLGSQLTRILILEVSHLSKMLGLAVSCPVAEAIFVPFIVFIVCYVTSCHELLASYIAGHDDTVTGLSFSADGNLLASGGKDGCVEVWDTSGNLRNTFKIEDEDFEWIKWHPRRYIVWPGSINYTAWVFGVDTSESYALNGHHGPVTCGDFAFNGHSAAVTCLAVRSCSNIARTGGYDGWSIPCWGTLFPSSASNLPLGRVSLKGFHRIEFS
ncbi:Angio-associated migratory cell protein-like protein [Drosera capensis]